MKRVILFSISTLLVLCTCDPNLSNKANDFADLNSNKNNLARSLDQIIKHFNDSGFIGCVLVADSNKLILNKSYGFSKTVIDSASCFWIASNTKPFTAIAIMKLVEEGKLSVKDSLPQFFKNVPSDKVHITIEQLLTHSSGLTDDIAYGEKNKIKAIDKILSSHLISKPGEQENYTNNGYELLEVIIELVSKEKYSDFIRKNIFKKADMHSSGFIGDSGIVVDPPSESKDYQSLRSVEFNGNNRTPVLFLGAGGISSNTIDLYKMMTALKCGKIINKNTLDLLFKPRINIQKKHDTTLSWGYGWVVQKTGHKTEIRHSGRSTWLHNSRMFFLHNGYIVIIWARDNGPDKKAWATEISRPLIRNINTLE